MLGMSETVSKGNGIGFVGLLQITFIILKLLDKIHWSWFWVLSPTWMTTALVVLIVILVVLYYT